MDRRAAGISRAAPAADASYRRSNGYVDRGDSKSVALSGAIDFFPHETVSITLRNDYGDVRPMRYFGTPLVEGQLRAGIRAENYNVADAIMDWKDNRTLLSLDWSPSRSFSVASVAYRLTSDRRWQNAETYCWVGQDGLCPNGIGFGAPGRVYRADYLGIRHQQEQIGSQGSATIRTGLFGTANNDLVVGFDVNRITLTYSHDFPPTAPYIEDEIDLIDPPPGLYQGVPILPRYKTHTNTYALFAEDRLKFGDRFSLVGGIRFERDTVKRRNFVYSPDGSISLVNAFPLGQTARIFRDTTWRIGAVYQPKAELSIYGQYSTGVDPLGTLTTYTTSASQFFFTNASGNQVEAGVKASFLEGRGAATIAAYKIVKTGLVAQRIVNGPIEQIGRRSSKGIEASLTLALAAGFGIDANGTLHRAEYDDFISGDADYSGNLPPGVPQRAANLWLTWRGLAGLEIRAGLRHVGRRFSDDANRFRVPSYSVVDGGVSYAISDRLAFDLRVYNLFDEDYAVSTYADEQWILGRPRSVDVSIRAGF
jgi:iron complex outermembrane recepter protein